MRDDLQVAAGNNGELAATHYGYRRMHYFELWAEGAEQAGPKGAM
jgi:hypothetical protein